MISYDAKGVADEMNKTVKAFALSLVIVTLALVPACRSKKTVEPVTAPTTVSETQAPHVARPTASATPGPEPHDFVQEKPVQEEPVPSDIEELNRVAKQ